MMCRMFELGPWTNAEMSVEKLVLKADGIDGGYFGGLVPQRHRGGTCTSARELKSELRAEGPMSESSRVR